MAQLQTWAMPASQAAPQLSRSASDNFCNGTVGVQKAAAPHPPCRRWTSGEHCWIGILGSSDLIPNGNVSQAYLCSAPAHRS